LLACLRSFTYAVASAVRLWLPRRSINKPCGSLQSYDGASAVALATQAASDVFVVNARMMGPERVSSVVGHLAQHHDGPIVQMNAHNPYGGAPGMRFLARPFGLGTCLKAGNGKQSAWSYLTTVPIPGRTDPSIRRRMPQHDVK
jgi:hypothetical protein